MTDNEIIKALNYCCGNIKNNDEVVVIDEQNEIWSFYGKSYLIGEKVKLVMFNNYTENNIHDDEIVNVKIIKK